MTIPEPIAIATLGGLSVQVLYVIDGLKAPADRRPDFKDWTYYLTLFLNVALSTILGCVYFDEDQKFNKIVYFHIGLSAPLIVRTLATTIPEVVRGSKASKSTKR